MRSDYNRNLQGWCCTFLFSLGQCFFSHCYDKMSGENNLKDRRVYLVSQFESMVHHGRQKWVQEHGVASHTVAIIKKRERRLIAGQLSFLFYAVLDPKLWDETTHIQGGFFSTLLTHSGNSFIVIPRGVVSTVILKSIKLIDQD